jgi:phasin family protein
MQQRHGFGNPLNLERSSAMYLTPEQIVALNQGNVDAAIGIARVNFGAAEKLAALNFSTAKAALEDGTSAAKALLGATDAQELVNLTAAAGQPALEKAIAYSRGVYEIASQANGEIGRIVEQRAGELNRTVASLVDRFAKDAPAGSDVAVAAVKSTLAAASSAYDSFTKAAKQATEIVEANLAAVATPELFKKAA